MTLSLKQLQQAFVDEVSGKNNEAFRALIVPGKLDGSRRIAIYQANHIGARINGLSNVFCVCQQILGQEAFNQLARDHVATCDSTHWDLNFYGEGFIGFLQQQCQSTAALADLFYLPELARLEWLFHISYFADVNPVCEVISQAAEDLYFHADTSLHVMSTALPVYQVWQNNREGKGYLAVSDQQANYYHVIFREQYFPQVYHIEQAQYQLLLDCLAGKSLAVLAELHGDIVSTSITDFIQLRWLVLKS